MFTYSLAAGSPPVIPSLMEMGLPVPDPSVPGSRADLTDVPHTYWGLDPPANDCDRNEQTCRHIVRYQNQLVLTLANSRAGFRQSKKHLPSIPCAALPTSLECALSWAGRAWCFCLCVLFLPSLEQGCSNEMLLPMTSEDFVAEGDSSNALSLACRGCLCCENYHSLSWQRLVKYPLF